MKLGTPAMLPLLGLSKTANTIILQKEFGVVIPTKLSLRQIQRSLMQMEHYQSPFSNLPKSPNHPSNLWLKSSGGLISPSEDSGNKDDPLDPATEKEQILLPS